MRATDDTRHRGCPPAGRRAKEVTLVPADSGAIRTGRDGELLA